MSDVDYSFESWFEARQGREVDPIVEKWMAAAAAGDVAALVAFLDSGMDINARDHLGETALTKAVMQSGDLATIRLLIERGTDLNYVDSFGYTALTHAIRRSLPGPRVTSYVPDPEPFKLLKEAGARFNLIDAFWTNDVDLARLRLEEGANPDQGEGTYFGSVLMEAARLGNVAMIELLLDFGANIEGEDDLGNRPLLSAAEFGRIEAVKCLIDRGAEVDAEDWSGITALGKAALLDYHAVAEVLIARGARRGVLDEAALNHPIILAVLIDEKLREVDDVDHWLGHGCVRISMIAAARGNPDIVRLLLDRGAAHLDRLDNHSLLAEAASHGHLEVIRLLIDRGACLDAVGSDGLTPLAWAIQNGQEEAAKLLGLAGATS